METINILTAVKRKEGKKRDNFQHAPAQKTEAAHQNVSERKDKRRYKKRSDAGPQIDPNLDPEKIVGAADSGGELMFLVKWKGTKFSSKVC